ncbi:Glycosyltransferase [Macleaya cordata]|uniref:Glycosyltransferase n=1 Tax=Macleaya cordata TaxID=56857 RepID=A0A200PWT2_MACCD|nr:Glycosyltransferase [Macleaya cordata]
MFKFRRCTGHTKSLFSTISFAALLFLILLSGSVFSNLSLHSVAIKLKKQACAIHPLEVYRQFSSNSTSLTLLSIKEETGEAYIEHPKRQKPPTNPSPEEERIELIVKTLPQLEILKSTALTQQFAAQAQKFFDSGCEVKFFMTWISPAISFGKKEFFVVESVFKAHPNGCLMILSRTMGSSQGNKILRPLTERGFKVIALAPDLPLLFNNTPAETWFDELKKGTKDPGRVPLAQNLSNLLRLVILYKYGGVYLDTDFIVLKTFSGLRNSIGAQSMDLEARNWTRLNNAVLIFDKNHPLLFKFIEEFSLTFDGNKWGHNGPYLVSRVIEKVAERPGFNFTVLPPIAFYPVDWNKIGGFFLKPKNPHESKWVAAKLLQLSGETYGIHLWNKQTSRLRIEEGSIIGQLISDHCVVCEDIYSS